MFKLTGNQLKLIAMITMTIDHIGMELFPQYLFLRIIGRLAMPIYAYMIAEGCRHTHDRLSYLLRLLGLGVLCQLVYFFAMDSLYMCILVTFSLSVMLICLYDWKKFFFWLALPVVFVVTTLLPGRVPGTDFDIDYGFFGVLLPFLVYLGKTPMQRLLGFSAGVILLGLDYGWVQWYALATIPLLALYGGQRGKAKIGKLFYWYYPVHLLIIHGLQILFFS